MTIFTLTQYDDGSGPRLKVDLGHPTSIGEQTIRIEGMGGATAVLAEDIDNLIGALRAAQQHLENEA